MKKAIHILLAVLLIAGLTASAQIQRGKNQNPEKPKREQPKRKKGSNPSPKNKPPKSSPQKPNTPKSGAAKPKSNGEPDKNKNAEKPIEKPKQEVMAFDVTFTCNVDDAVMYIDGNNYGNPNGRRTLKVGLHEVQIEAEGYEDYIATINVAAGSTSFDFNLNRIMPVVPSLPEVTVLEVTFTCNVYDAEMYIDGSNVGNPNGTHTLKAGLHEVVITSEDYEVYTTIINVGIGSTTFDFKLNRIMPESPPIANVKTINLKNLSFNMIWVEGGTFTMGSSHDEEFNPEDATLSTQVTLSGYYIGECEVTQELWQTVMEHNPSRFSRGTNRPVEQVTWEDCQKFIRKLNQLTGLNFRLPTETEWEYAARGGNQSHGYLYSGSNSLDNAGWYAENSGGTTHTVGMKVPNELGLYDMSGNVWEWCQDSYYNRGESKKTLRGGSYYRQAESCCVFAFNTLYRNGIWNDCGLRLVASSL